MAECIVVLTKYALLVTTFPEYCHLITRVQHIKQKMVTMGWDSINGVTYDVSLKPKSKCETLKTLRKSNDLLAVLHTSLHAHRVSLRARGPIALAWVSRALLGP